jgi:Flp pilus assembly protein TadD
LVRGLDMLESARDSPAQGLLSVLAARNHLRQGEIDAAIQAARRAVELSRQFNDPDLHVFST